MNGIPPRSSNGGTGLATPETSTPSPAPPGGLEEPAELTASGGGFSEQSIGSSATALDEGGPPGTPATAPEEQSRKRGRSDSATQDSSGGNESAQKPKKAKKIIHRRKYPFDFELLALL